MPAPTKKLFSGSRAAVVVAVLLGTLAHTRVAHDVRLFSPADELTHLTNALVIVDGGLRGFRDDVNAFLATKERWFFPAPTRYAQHFAAAAACATLGRDFRSLVAVSTLASVAAVVLAALLARRLAGNRAAVLAALLLGSSPLWLHLGRRALSDAHHAAVGLAAVWAFLEASRPGARASSSALAVLLLAWHVATKETGVELLAALAVVHCARATRGEVRAGRPLLLLFVAGVATYLVFSALAGSPWAYPRVLQGARWAAERNEYIDATSRGPLYRPLLDFALLSPLLTLLAPFALARALFATATSPRARLLRATAAVALLVIPALLLVSFGTTMGWNARYALLLDALLRVVLAAWLSGWAARGGSPRAVATRGAVVVAVVVVNALVEAWIFRRVFVERGVYDPVTSAVMSALGLQGS